MKKNIMIIGGNGFIGVNITKLLIQKGYCVYIFDIQKPYTQIQNVNYIEGDFFDDYVLKNALVGIDYVIHALSTVNPGNSNDKYVQAYERDFIQTIKLCKMLEEMNIDMLFLSSGGTVYGEQQIQPISELALPHPINHYGNIKLCIENTIHTFNMQRSSKMRIARISNPYGPGQDFLKGVGFIDAVLKKSMTNQTVEVWGDGNIVRDYIHIDDVCNMLCELIEYKGDIEIFNISSNCGTSQNQIIKFVTELGLCVRVDYKENRSVDVRKVVLDNSRIMEIYKGEICNIKKGIKEYYGWLLKHRSN